MYCVIRASVPSLHNVYRRYDTYIVAGAYKGKERGTAFDFEHLFNNSVYGHPLHGEYPLRSVALITLPRMYA